MNVSFSKSFVLLIVLFSFSQHVAFAQIWSEDFSGLSDGITSGPGLGGEDWGGEIGGVTSPNFSVQSEVYVGENTDEIGAEAVWATEVISLDPARYHEFSMDINWVVNNFNIGFPLFTRSDPDYFRVYYKIDGGNEVLIYENISSGSDASGSSTLSQVLKGSSLQIVVRTFTDNVTAYGFEIFEDYYNFDNVSVNEITTIYSLADGNWNTASSWSFDDFAEGTRASCGCTPSSSETVVIGNGNIIDLNSNGTTSGIEIRSGSTLQWTTNADLNITRGGNVIVQDGGSIYHNGRNADISIEASDVICKVEVNDAINGIDIDRILLNANASNIVLYLDGSGRINLGSDLLIGNGAFTNNSIINSSTGSVIVGQLQFGSRDNSFTNSLGSTISVNTLFVKNNTLDDNVVTNYGTMNIADIDLNNSDLIFENYGTLIMTGNFMSFGGNESINNYSGSTWSYSGNSTSTSGLGIYLNYGSNNFEYTASGDQEIIVPQDSYSNLIIDGGGTKSLAGNVSMTGNLTLTNGIVDTNGNTFVFLGDGATFSGGSFLSYIDGLVAKTGSGDFIFPTGDEGIWARIGISNLSGSETFTAEYFGTGHSDLFDVGTMNNISKLEYWTLGRSGSADAFVTLYFEDANRSGITDVSELVVAHYNGSEWESVGASTASSNSITSDLVTDFSPFTFGSIGLSNPLPVKLVSFDVVPIGNAALVQWQTASEQNNDYFSIERSNDGVEFASVGIVDGNGTVNEVSSYQFIDKDLSSGIYYYRLKQIDFDGSFEYFRPDFVEITDREKSASIIVYPNPVSGDLLYVKMALLDFDVNGLVEIVDINGTKIDSFEIEQIADQETGILIIPLSQSYSQGHYLLKIYLPKRGSYTQKFMVW